MTLTAKLLTSDQTERVGLPCLSYNVKEKKHENISYAQLEIETAKNIFETYYICSTRHVSSIPESDIKGCYFAVAYITNESNKTVDRIGPYT